MAYLEIDSFVTKLKLLCSAGIDARLEIETNNGKAKFTLSAEIDLPSEVPVINTPSLTRRSPSYGRRLARRQAMRERNVTEIVTGNKAEEAEKASVEVSSVTESEAEKASTSCEVENVPPVMKSSESDNAEQASLRKEENGTNGYSCRICEFWCLYESSWKTHLATKHRNTFNEKSNNENKKTGMYS